MKAIARLALLTMLMSLAAASTVGAGTQPLRLAQQQRVASQQPASPIPIEQTLYLIRSTLLTLNDANRSGNYTVLRDLASPDFQAKNTAADLAQIFSDLRKRDFDLHAVAISAPQLAAAPRIEQNNMLRLTGYFPTQPLRINFDMLFQNVSGQWRLFGLSVATPQAPAQPAASQAPEQTSKAAKPARR